MDGQAARWCKGVCIVCKEERRMKAGWLAGGVIDVECEEKRRECGSYLSNVGVFLFSYLWG